MAGPKNAERLNQAIAEIEAGKALEDYLYRQQTDKRTLRRIDREHQLVYKVADYALVIAQCRYHY